MFTNSYNDLEFTTKNIFLIHLKVADPKIVFEPNFHDCCDTMIRCFNEAIAGGEGLPRVEIGLFGEMKHQKLLLRSVKQDEEIVQSYVQKAIGIFKGHYRVTPLHYCLITSLPYYPTTPLPHYPITPLLHHPTTPLPYYPITPLLH